MSTSHPSLGESDWEDQDLLTLDEAGERLEAELASEREALTSARESHDDEAADRLEARIQALQEALARIRG